MAKLGSRAHTAVLQGLALWGDRASSALSTDFLSACLHSRFSRQCELPHTLIKFRIGVAGCPRLISASDLILDRASPIPPRWLLGITVPRRALLDWRKNGYGSGR